MHCPRCGYPMYSHSNLAVVPDGYKPSIERKLQMPDTKLALHTEACAQCGFEMPCYWWDDLDYDIWLRYRDRGDSEQVIDNDASWKRYQERAK